MNFGMRWVEMKEIVATPACEENYFQIFFVFFAFTFFYFFCFIFFLFNTILRPFTALTSYLAKSYFGFRIEVKKNIDTLNYFH